MDQLQWLSQKMLRLSLKLMVGNILVKDGNDLEAIAKAIEEANAETDKPSIIEVKTIIGYGAEGQGTSAVHGAPIGQDGIDHSKGVYGYDAPAFTVQMKSPSFRSWY